MVKGKGSPHLLAKKVGERMAGSRHQRRAEAAQAKKEKRNVGQLQR